MHHNQLNQGPHSGIHQAQVQPLDPKKEKEKRRSKTKILLIEEKDTN